jgi:hypothetical protein
MAGRWPAVLRHNVHSGARSLAARTHRILASRDALPDVLERRSQERLDPLGPAPRAELLLHVLKLPDFDPCTCLVEVFEATVDPDDKRE